MLRLPFKFHGACALVLTILQGHSFAWQDQKTDLTLVKFLAKNCVQCHDDADGPGSIDLTVFELPISSHQEAAIAEKILDQVHADLMPPLGEARPDHRLRVVGLIELEKSLFESKFGEAYRQKLLRPSFGNYVDHELLFSGTVAGPAFTPARVWRNSPYIFDAKKRVSRSVKGIQNPYTFSTAPDGIRDYAATSQVDASVVETIKLNAAAEIEYQLAEAKELVGKPVENRRRPNPFVPFVSAGTTITDEQIRLVIATTYQRVVVQNSSEELLDKYCEFLKSNLDQSNDPELSLKAALTAIYLSPEAIYRNEWGNGQTLPDGRRMLSPDEIASSLSFALFDHHPNGGGRNENEKVIAKAVAEGKLNTRQDVARVVADIFDTEAFNPIGGQAKNSVPRVMRFFHEYFGYHKAPEVFKDAQRVREHGLWHAPDRLVKDADNLIKVILREDRKVIERLLTSNEALVFHDGDNQAQIDRHERMIEDLQSYDEEKVKQEIARRKAGVLKKPKYKANPALVPAEHARIERLGKKMLSEKKAELQRAQKNGVSMPRTKNRDRQYMKAYNLSPRTWNWPAEQPFELPKHQRAGILTHPAWLVAHSVNDGNDPIHRGIWVYEKLLAGVIADVPPDVDARIPEDPHKTLRQRMSPLRGDACWKCHRRINPLGEAFEMYDDFGRFRDKHYFDGEGNIFTSEFESVPALEGNGTELKKLSRDERVKKGEFSTQMVNASGSFDELGIPELSGDFENAIEMIGAIAKTDRARQSFIRHLFRYLMGRNEMLSDSQTLIDADRAYLDSGGSFKAVVVSLLSSDSFLYRR